MFVISIIYVSIGIVFCMVVNVIGMLKLNVMLRYVCGIVKKCFMNGQELVMNSVMIDNCFVSVLSGRISKNVMNDSLIVIVMVFYVWILLDVSGWLVVCFM